MLTLFREPMFRDLDLFDHWFPHRHNGHRASELQESEVF